MYAVYHDIVMYGLLVTEAWVKSCCGSKVEAANICYSDKGTATNSCSGSNSDAALMVR